MKRWARCLLLLCLGLFFLASGVLKLGDVDEFGRAILRYRIIGEFPAAFAALLVPWLEIVASLGLLLKTWRPAGLALILILLAVFEIALASAWLRGLDIDCGCLGRAGGSSVQVAFFRNVFLLLAAGWLLRQEKGDR